jgi:malonyl CoA-acyl carrier protein transacylase
MLAIKADVKTVEKLKTDVESRGDAYWLDYSCFNGPSQIVVGGPDHSISEMEQLCRNNNIKCTIINEILALHTRALKPAESSFRIILNVMSSIITK